MGGIRELSANDRAWLSDPQVRRVLSVIQTSTGTKRNPYLPNDNSELGVRVNQEAASTAYTVRELVNAVRLGEYADNTHAGWPAVFSCEPGSEYVLELSRARPLARMFWFALGRLVKLAALLLFRLEIVGEENLPRSGAFLLFPNNQSGLDPPIVLSCLPWRMYKDLFIVGTSELFGKGLASRIVRTARLFAIDSGTYLVPTLQVAAYGLNRGIGLLLYPERERSIDGRSRVLEKGGAFLANDLNVPIYSVATDSCFEAWPRGRAFQTFSRIKIQFGGPIYSGTLDVGEGSAHEAITSAMRIRVVEM